MNNYLTLEFSVDTESKVGEKLKFHEGSEQVIKQLFMPGRLKAKLTGKKFPPTLDSSF
jgi:hypothetical protein